MLVVRELCGLKWSGEDFRGLLAEKFITWVQEINI